MTKQNPSRRSFIQASVAAGGGLMLGFHMPQALAATISRARSRRRPPSAPRSTPGW
jgi:hypothetical protein